MSDGKKTMKRREFIGAALGTVVGTTDAFTACAVPNPNTRPYEGRALTRARWAEATRYRLAIEVRRPGGETHVIWAERVYSYAEDEAYLMLRAREVRVSEPLEVLAVRVYLGDRMVMRNEYSNRHSHIACGDILACSVTMARTPKVTPI